MSADMIRVKPNTHWLQTKRCHSSQYGVMFCFPIATAHYLNVHLSFFVVPHSVVWVYEVTETLAKPKTLAYIHTARTRLINRSGLDRKETRSMVVTVTECIANSVISLASNIGIYVYRVNKSTRSLSLQYSGWAHLHFVISLFQFFIFYSVL